MTENLTKFLEAVSDDEAFKERLNEAKTPEKVIELAKEKGFTLTEDDLKKDKPSGGRALSDDELEAVAGGMFCACVLGGAGESGVNDKFCGCPVVGEGYGGQGCQRCMVAGGGESGAVRCGCGVVGGGKSVDD